MEVGRIFYSVDLDTKDLDKKSGEVESNVKKLGDKAAKAFVTAIKAGTVAAATALAKFTYDATKEFARFEQLSGGMKKIFDEIDYSIIAKDAADAYKSMNLSANDYMERITKVGAAFASSMGDKKGYDTARRGMQALADYATGTGISIEFLMDKYAMISRASSTYLTIADQFAGILPQTNKDFIKQAQGLGFLNKQYKEMSQIPVVEYQEALTKMIEHGVGKMNLLGNTVMESGQTISGSIGMMKASWTNFMTSLGDAEADHGLMMQRLIESVKTVAENVIPIVRIIFDRIYDMLPSQVKGIVDAFGSIVGAIKNTIKWIGSVYNWFREGTVPAKVLGTAISILAGAFVGLKVAMALGAAFDAIKIGFATFQLITIPNAMASLTAFRTLITTPLAFGAISVAAAVAALALIFNEAIKARDAVNSMHDAIQRSEKSLAESRSAVGQKFKAGDISQADYQKYLYNMANIEAQTKARQDELKKGVTGWIYSLVSGRASGGPITSGTPYIVGEAGPELIIPKTSGYVMNNEDLSKFASRNITNNFNIFNQLDLDLASRQVARNVGLQ